MPYVKIREGRDEYGHRIYNVAESRGTGSSKEVRLTHHANNVPKEGFWLYEAHTLRDGDTRRMDLKEFSSKRQMSNQIGLPKIKPGKKK